MHGFAWVEKAFLICKSTVKTAAKTAKSDAFCAVQSQILLRPIGWAKNRRLTCIFYPTNRAENTHSVHVKQKMGRFSLLWLEEKPWLISVKPIPVNVCKITSEFQPDRPIFGAHFGCFCAAQSQIPLRPIGWAENERLTCILHPTIRAQNTETGCKRALIFTLWQNCFTWNNGHILGPENGSKNSKEPV